MMSSKFLFPMAADQSRRERGSEMPTRSDLHSACKGSGQGRPRLVFYSARPHPPTLPALPFLPPYNNVGK